jgi:phosphate transport system permease protein
MALELRESAPLPDDDIEPDEDRTDLQTRPRSFHRRDWWVLVGCAASSFSVMYLVFYRLAPLSGVVGFTLAWYLAFLVTYRLVVSELEGTRFARDRLMAVIVATSGALVLIPLVLLVGYVVMKGLHGITWAFLTKDQNFGGPLDPYSAGGAAHAIVGTLEQVTLAVALSVPLGIMCAIFLNEIGGPLQRPVRIFVDAMSGVPTIIAGLFIYSTWQIALGHGFSGFAASLAISISMLPVITRTAEEVLRLVPDGLREASLALGTTEWRTVSGVVLPTARAGLVTAIILGVARAVGETAPLIMTSFGSSVMNANPFRNAQSSLPIYIFRNYSLGDGVPLQRAWSAALVLITLVLVLFTLARVLGGWDRGNGRRSKAATTLGIIEPPD